MGTKIIIQVEAGVRLADAMRGIQLSHIYLDDGAVVSFKGILLNVRKFNDHVIEISAVKDKEE